MSDSQYEQANIFDVLVAAAVEQITIEMASNLLSVAQAHWRLWLWEVFKPRLGFALSLPIPPPATVVVY